MLQWWFLYLLTKTFLDLNSDSTNNFFMNQNILHKIFSAEDTNISYNKTNPNLHFMYYNNWELKPVGGFFGIELINGDLRKDMDSDLLQRLLNKYHVVIFRNQNLSNKELVHFGKLLGRLEYAHPVVPSINNYPEILQVDSSKGGKNALWHTDVSFIQNPPAYSILSADVIPLVGGDTLWTDLQVAYDALSPSTQNYIEQLEAVHKITPLAYWGEPPDSALSRKDAQRLLESSKKFLEIVHPVVRMHPKTNKSTLFVNPGFTSHILGLSNIESVNTLKMLYEHSIKPEFTLRHKWQPGDIVVWDNQLTMHYAVNDYVHQRKMRRIIVKGDTPYNVVGKKSRIFTDPIFKIR
jgi:taurine dioxygenase